MDVPGRVSGDVSPRESVGGGVASCGGMDVVWPNVGVKRRGVNTYLVKNYYCKSCRSGFVVDPSRGVLDVDRCVTQSVLDSRHGFQKCSTAYHWPNCKKIGYEETAKHNAEVVCAKCDAACMAVIQKTFFCEECETGYAHDVSLGKHDVNRCAKTVSELTAQFSSGVEKCGSAAPGLYHWPNCAELSFQGTHDHCDRCETCLNSFPLNQVVSGAGNSYCSANTDCLPRIPTSFFCARCQTGHELDPALGKFDAHVCQPTAAIQARTGAFKCKRDYFWKNCARLEHDAARITLASQHDRCSRCRQHCASPDPGSCAVNADCDTAISAGSTYYCAECKAGFELNPTLGKYDVVGICRVKVDITNAQMTNLVSSQGVITDLWKQGTFKCLSGEYYWPSCKRLAGSLGVDECSRGSCWSCSSCRSFCRVLCRVQQALSWASLQEHCVLVRRVLHFPLQFSSPVFQFPRVDPFFQL